MEDLIKQAFLHVETLGPHVQQGRYDLENSEGEIILPSLWELTIQPGWSIIQKMWPLPDESPDRWNPPAVGRPPPPSMPSPPPVSGHQQEPIKFMDAVGRRFNIPFHIARRWDAVETLIKQASYHIDFLRPHVDQGHYDLCAPDDEIILPSLWNIVVRPGMSVEMRMWPDLQPVSRPPEPRPPPSPAMSGAPRRVPPTGGEAPGQGLQPQARPAGDLRHKKQNPLHEAVLHGDPELVRLLLRHGADPRNRGRDGRSAQQVAEEVSQELAGVIRAGVPLEGPPTTRPGPKDADGGPAPSRPRAPAHKSPKWQACMAFEAIAVQFRLDGHEERYQKTVSVYELLYGKGPRSMFDAQSQAEAPPKFTWYHLPANNVSILTSVMSVIRG